MKLNKKSGKTIAVVGVLTLTIALLLLYSFSTGTFSSQSGIKVQFLDKDKKVLKEELYAAVVNDISNVQYVNAIPLVKNGYKSDITVSATDISCTSMDKKYTISITCDGAKQDSTIAPNAEKTWNCLFDIDTWQTAHLNGTASTKFMCTDEIDIKYKDSLGVQQYTDKGYLFYLTVGKDSTSVDTPKTSLANPVVTEPTTAQTTPDTIASTTSSTTTTTVATQHPLSIACSSDSDCGNPVHDVNAKNCLTSYQLQSDKQTNPVCYNPGTSSSRCDVTVNYQSSMTCPNGCVNNACALPQTQATQPPATQPPTTQPLALGCLPDCISCFASRYYGMGTGCIIKSSYMQEGGVIANGWLIDKVSTDDYVKDVNDWQNGIPRPGCNGVGVAGDGALHPCV